MEWCVHTCDTMATSYYANSHVCCCRDLIMEVKQLTNDTQSSEKKLNKPQGFFLCTQVTAADTNFKGELQMPPPHTLRNC